MFLNDEQGPYIYIYSAAVASVSGPKLFYLQSGYQKAITLSRKPFEY